MYVIWNAQFNPYKWMLDDPQNEDLIFCRLSLDDGTYRLYSPTVSLLLSAVQSAQRHQPHFSMWLALAVLVCWVVRSARSCLNCRLAAWG